MGLVLICFNLHAQWVLFDKVSKGNAIAHDGTLFWLIGIDDQIYYSRDDGPYSGSTANESKWAKYSSTRRCHDIDGYQGDPFVIGTNNKVYKYHGGQETLLGEGRRIAVDPTSGVPWIIGMDWKLYFYNGKSWIRYHDTAEGIDIDAYGGVPFFIGKDNKIYKGKASGNGYDKIDTGAGLKISSYNKLIFISGTDRKLYHFSNNKWEEFTAGFQGFDICAGGSNPFIVGHDKRIYYKKD